MPSPLNETQRRVLANLSIPRNADDLTAHLRPYVTDSTEGVDHVLRNSMSDNGWVINLGQHTDPAKLASKVQHNKKAMELPDEKADIYSRRMTRPDLAWRMDGDLWMLTKEGLEQLHAPTVDSPPLPPSQVQAAVDAEWARVLREPFVPSKIVDGEIVEHGTSLANALLDDEFMAWYHPVADECERVWNVRPQAPLAGGASGWTDAYEVTIIDCENQKSVPTQTDPWYMTLSILAFTDADTGTTAGDGSHIPTYTGWARKSVAGTDMPAASSGAGSSANTSAIIFAACTAGSSTILAAGNCVTLAASGVMRKWFDVASTVVSTTQTPAQFAIGAYTTSAA